MTSLVPSNSLKEFLEVATKRYQEALKSDDAEGCRTYLRDSRKLSGVSAASFKLGYVADPLPGHEKYQGRIAVPYLTRSGVVSIRFRHVPELNDDGEPVPYDGPKMLSVPGDIPRPYNPSDLERRESFVCIAEGEWDAMIAHQDGLPCIGIAGVNGWRTDFKRLFIGYNAVYVLADNDDKGQGGTFAEKVASQIGNARVVMLPQGHDVNSWYALHGEGSVRALVEGKE